MKKPKKPTRTSQPSGSVSLLLRMMLAMEGRVKVLEKKADNPLLELKIVAPPIDPLVEPGPEHPFGSHKTAHGWMTGHRVGYKPGKCDVLWEGRVIPVPAGAKTMGDRGPLVYVLVNHPGNSQTPKGWTTRGCYPWNLVRLCEAAKCEGHGI